MMWLSSSQVLFTSRRRHTRLQGDWISDVCSSDLDRVAPCKPWQQPAPPANRGLPPLLRAWRTKQEQRKGESSPFAYTIILAGGVAASAQLCRTRYWLALLVGNPNWL